MKDISFDDLFGDQEIDLECPECNGTFQVEFAIISKDNAEVTCPHCNVTIRMEHDDTTKKTLRDSDRALKDFNKSLNDLERSFKKFK
ncbi:MJ0042-type zinc finger domain-containing protein [Neobacillus sp.]|uniref:MJ0042-type zinc finger domain-containing protein n=1 Tax=Neobacillus sp. TaxID=2675273 RepID=UPI0035B511CD